MKLNITCANYSRIFYNLGKQPLILKHGFKLDLLFTWIYDILPELRVSSKEPPSFKTRHSINKFQHVLPGDKHRLSMSMPPPIKYFKKVIISFKVFNVKTVPTLKAF